MIETILFDLDGTLIDTELAAAKSIRGSFAEWNIALSEDDAGFITGRTWEKAFEFLFSKYSIPISKKDAAERMLSRYRDELQRELVEVAGARECVRSLAKEFPLALVSGSHRSEILFALKKLDILDCFRVVLGAEDYPRSKPAPDGYEKALSILGGKKETSLVFEDSEAGVESALAAGMQVCVITSTNHFGVNTSKGHYFVPDLRGVDPVWVKRLKV